MPSSSLFLLGQASTAFSGGAIGALSHIGWAAKAVLVVLCIFSLVSWAIIIYKGVALRRAYTQSQIFLQVFRKSSKFSEVNSVCVQLKASPLPGYAKAQANCTMCHSAEYMRMQPPTAARPYCARKASSGMRRSTSFLPTRASARAGCMPSRC